MFKSGVVEESKRKELVDELRLRLTSKKELRLEEYKLEEDKFLERYLCESRWDLEGAESLLVSYLELNAKFGTESLLLKMNKEYPEEARNILWSFGGLDYEGRPIAMFLNMDVDMRGLLEEFSSEKVDRMLMECVLINHGKLEQRVLKEKAEFGVVVMDAANVKYSRLLHKKTIEICLHLSKTMQRHTPGLIGKYIIINAPKILKGLVTMIQKSVGTSSQIVMYGPGEKGWREKLREHVPDESLQTELGPAPF